VTGISGMDDADMPHQRGPINAVIRNRSSGKRNRYESAERKGRPAFGPSPSRVCRAFHSTYPEPCVLQGIGMLDPLPQGESTHNAALVGYLSPQGAVVSRFPCTPSVIVPDAPSRCCRF